MKIVCDNCATKYSIADEKVSGKSFKLRCKKCSHIIVVKGTTEGEAPQPAPTVVSSAGYDGMQQAPEAAPASSEPAAVWHLVIDREQVGPLTDAEVRAKFAAGQIDAETYIWKEGFEDWLKVGSVDEFRDLASSAEATRRAEPVSDYVPSQEPQAAVPFAAAAPSVLEPAHVAAPNASTMMGMGESMGYVAPAGKSTKSTIPQTDVVSSSASAAAAAAAGASDMEVKSMTGARSENSVLFSLNNLQALASGGGAQGAPAPAAAAAPRPGFANSQTDGSGLIDIRAMAAQTLSSSNPFAMGGPSAKPDELPMVNDAPLFSPVAPALMMPTVQQEGMPKWVWGVIAGGGALTIGMIVVLIMALRPPQPQPTPTPPVAGGGPSEAVAVKPEAQPVVGTPGNPPSAKPPEPGTPPPKGPEPAAAGEPGKVKKPKGEKGEKAEKPGKGKEPQQATPPPVAPKVEQPVAPPPVKPAKPAKPRDDLDALLEAGSPGGGKPKSDAVKKDAPEQLSMDTIKSTLKGVSSAAQACKPPGTYLVKLTIGRNGRVSDASVPGKAGDPGADCVARAVKSAKFPEFTGDPQSLSYPFIIR